LCKSSTLARHPKPQDIESSPRRIEINGLCHCAPGWTCPYFQAPEAVMGKSWFMKRIALAAIAATTMLFAGNAIAQQQPDWDKIQIKTTDLGNKTYMLEGQAATSPSRSVPTASSSWTPSSRRCPTRSRRPSR
jgi:hypothetical protein